MGLSVDPVGTPATPQFPGHADRERGTPLFRPAMERLALVFFWLYLAAWMGALFHAWTANPQLHHGDAFSDANVLNAAANFERWGLGLNCGLSTHFGTWSPQHPVKPYTHYPPGPEWIHMGLRGVGLHDLANYRGVSVGFAALALVLWWWVVRRVTGSYIIALFAAFFYSFCSSFTEYSDSLHQHSVMQLTFMICLAAWTAFEGAATTGRRALWLGIAAVIFFLDMWITFEHILMIPGYVAIRALLAGLRRNWRGALLIGLLPLLALSTRLAHNAIALGGMGAAIDDLSGSAKYRSDGAVMQVTIPRVFSIWIERLGAGKGSQGQEFDPGNAVPVLTPRTGITALAMLVLLVACWHRTEIDALRRGFGYAALLLICGILWFVVMRGHSYVHRHVIMLLLPGVSLLLAVLTAAAVWQWRGSPAHAPVRIVGPVLACLLVVWWARDIRHSRAGSILFDLDPNYRRVLADASAASEMRRAASEASFANVQRMHFVGKMYPVLTFECKRPFVYSTELPKSLPPGEAIWIEHWFPEEQQMAAEAFERFGLPDVFGGPVCSLVFRNTSRAATVDTDVVYQGGIRLVQFRQAETLDGQAWAVQGVFELAKAVDRDRFVASLLVETPNGASPKSVDSGLNNAMPRGRQPVVSLIVPKSEVKKGARFRFAIWDKAENRFSPPLDIQEAKLPPGAAWNPDGWGFSWSADRVMESSKSAATLGLISTEISTAIANSKPLGKLPGGLRGVLYLQPF